MAKGAESASKVPAALKKAAEAKAVVAAKAPAAAKAKVPSALPKAPLSEADKRKLVEEKIQKMFAEGKPITVVALGKGTYPNTQRKVKGDEFGLRNPADFSHEWMKLKD